MQGQSQGGTGVGGYGYGTPGQPGSLTPRGYGGYGYDYGYGGASRTYGGARGSAGRSPLGYSRGYGYGSGRGNTYGGYGAGGYGAAGAGRYGAQTAPGQFGQNFQRAYRPLNATPGAPFLGVTLDPHYPNSAVVTYVHANSAAARYGLRPGDTITELNGQPVSSGEELAGLIAQLAPGTPITVRITRPQSLVVQGTVGSYSPQ